jgi:hypothetical protein
MTDEVTTPAAPITADAPVARRCPWCSEPLPVDATDRCPNCEAILVSEGDGRVPGVTEVLAASAAKARMAEPPKRSKLLAWISGDVDDGVLATPAPPDAIALPPRNVRREMLRMQLESEGLTVSPDGSIELAADATSPTPISAATASADVGAADETQGDVRKAS